MMSATTGDAVTVGGTGRRRLITREKIADAGIEMTLPAVTFTGLAKRLGVSLPALYKHVDGIDELRILVAEEIFSRWELPELASGESIEAHLARLARSLRDLVLAHPGLAQYLSRIGRHTPVALGKIDAHQTEVAERFGLSPTQASWVLSTVTFTAVALSDVVFHAAVALPTRVPLAGSPDLRTLSRIEPTPLLDGPEQKFAFAMEAMIRGALLQLTALP
ncbi:TetR/AcrR family transcriptional regulator [Leucobacter sp. M11]|uniref:TetR/AcrR family transcriptional regulator n=1 Tax=Leucobacter sp. M11 TaxID=2993565 RepID=UPI002D7F0EFB|nr:TetR/AcrR family transcriptional regulator C-terminal domain-containing protein [Leucobacter sp. M11]MEB4613873.1 TetR/AcrR family transcriptional regulator C-terminal domain-containing protein [Leucobacter sp. M11]